MKDYPISLLCRIAGVSKSGYYKWWKNADKVKDEFDILLIAEMFFKSKQKAGFRTIKMRLLTEYGIIMNHKKNNQNNEKIRNDNKNQKNKSI